MCTTDRRGDIEADPSGPPLKRQRLDDEVAMTDSLSKGGFKFLELSGEIRNAIYELCAQDSESHLVPRAADDNDAHMPRNFALAQTNRQIRKEFLPVYRRNVNTTISIRDVNEYTETFLSTSEPVVTALRIMVHEAHHPAVQMHPFISACTRNPGLNVTFEREDPSIYHDNEVDDKLLNNLIAVSRGSHQTPWTDFLREAVVGIKVNVFPFPFHETGRTINIELNEDHAEMSYRRRPPAAQRAWEREVDFPDRRAWKMKILYVEDQQWGPSSR